MADFTFDCVLIATCLLAFCLNIAVLIYKLCTRKLGQINAFFTINLTTTNILTTLFLFILSMNAIMKMIQDGSEDQPILQNKHLCQVAHFIQSFAYEAKLGFLLLKCADIRYYIIYHVYVV